MADKSGDAVARIEPFAKRFAQAVADEGRTFGIIQFKGAVAVVCFDVTPGSGLLREACSKILDNNQNGLMKAGDLKLS